MKVKFRNTLILILTCVYAGQALAQTPPKDVWNQIEVKARDLKLGSPRAESPEPRQTPLPRNQGWWQAFEEGWVYWSPANGARVVRGKIFEAWGRQGWEQGSLSFPVADEESCRPPDSNDRYQRFEGGVIHWKAATNSTTIYNNDRQGGQSFAVSGICYPTLVAAPNERATAPLTTNRVEPNVSIPAPGPAPTPDKPTVDRNRGLFRITIDTIRVEHVVHDGVLDAGDDVFVMWDAQEFNVDGRLVGSPRAGQSLIYGDITRNRAYLQAGTQGENGGLRTGDKISGRSAPSANRLPMLVGELELVDGENAFVFAPTVWTAENNVGDNAHQFRQRFQSRTRFAAFDVRRFLEANNAQFHWIYSLSRGGDDWFDMRYYAGMTINEDRPIGSARAFHNSPNSSVIQIYDFIPHAFLLTYKSVTDFMQSAGREAQFEAQYRGTGGGVYVIAMTIQRVK